MNPSDSNAEPAKTAEKPAADHTGQTALVKNVVFSWAGQMIFIIAGFVMPRLIDEHLGRELLGVWDFCWALANYCAFIQGGVTSAVNRYVGRLWAKQDIVGISRVMSCATMSLSIAGLTIAAVSITGSYFVPQLFAERLGENASEARWVVLFLGLSLAVQASFGAFNGLITGCHRWDLKNMIHAGWYSVTAVAMGTVLFLGGGLAQLALIYFVGECLGQGTRALFAFRICPGLRLRSSLINRASVKELHAYGGKTLLPQISLMIKGTVTSTLIVTTLGPGALAILMRPRALVKHANTLVRRMTMTLNPTVSSLQALGGSREIRGLLVRSVRYSLYLQVPLLLGLAVFGAPIVEAWMGPDYARVGLIATVTLLSILPASMEPMISVLGGLNAHGKAGVGHLLGAVVSIGLVYLALRSGLGLVGAVLGTAIPSNIGALFYLPRIVGAKIGMKPSTLIWKAMVTPVLQLLPLGLGFLLLRIALPQNPFVAMGLSALLFGPVLMVFYWKHVFPAKLKDAVVRAIQRHRRKKITS